MNKHIIFELYTVHIRSINSFGGSYVPIYFAGGFFFGVLFFKSYK